LELMADLPGREFTAAQLAADVGIHRATGFSILSCLTSLDMVRRDPDRKTYSLGPQLLRLGAATAEKHRGSSVARREMFRLADELDIGGLLCARVDWDMILIDRVSDDPAFGVPPPDVMTAAIRPPLGAIFVAWSAQSAIAEWLSLAPPDSSQADMESFRRSVAAVRARGFSIGSVTEVEMQLEQILTRLQKVARTERMALALELADLVRTGTEAGRRGRRAGGRQPIDHLIGPIFDSSGEVVLTITIFGRAGQIHGGNLSTFAQPLVASCVRVTKAIGGIWPSRVAGQGATG
jgi:DNA-binding IclR family transcriptional regulator